MHASEIAELVNSGVASLDIPCNLRYSYGEVSNIMNTIFIFKELFINYGKNAWIYAYDNQGKYAETVVLYKQCLDKRTLVLGENHPDTLKTAENLARLIVEAEILYKGAK